MLSQENYKTGVGVLIAVCVIAGAAEAGSIAASSTPDPLLAGPPPGPCAVTAVGPDYVDGIDAAGQRVVPAARPAAKVLAGLALVTLPVSRHRRAEVTVGVDLAALAPSGCTLPPRR